MPPMSTALPKPAGVTGAVVIALVLAAWEAVSAVWAIAGSSTFDGVQDFLATRLPVGDLGEARERLSRIQAAVTSVAKPEHTFALAALTLPVAAWAIVAALRLNKGKPRSARWFAHAVTALVVVEVVQMAYAVHLYRTMQPLLTELFNASLPSASSLPANVDPAEIVRTMQSLLQVVTVSSTVLALGFAAAKVFVCLYARHCARKPEVLAWTA